MDSDFDANEDELSPPQSPTSSELCDMYQEWEYGEDRVRLNWETAAEEDDLYRAMNHGVTPHDSSLSSTQYRIILIRTNPNGERQTVTYAQLNPGQTLGDLIQRLGLDPEDAVMRYHTSPTPPLCATCSATSSHCNEIESVGFISGNETGASLGLTLGAEVEFELILKSTEVLLIIEYHHQSNEREYHRVLSVRLHKDSKVNTALEEAEKHFQTGLKLEVAYSSSGDIVDSEKTPAELQWVQPGTYSVQKLEIRTTRLSPH